MLLKFVLIAGISPGGIGQPIGHCPGVPTRRLHCVGRIFMPQDGEGWNVSSSVRAACLAVLVVAAAIHRLLPRVLLPHLLPTVLPSQAILRGELSPPGLPSLFLLCPLFLSPVMLPHVFLCFCFVTMLRFQESLLCRPRLLIFQSCCGKCNCVWIPVA